VENFYTGEMASNKEKVARCMFCRHFKVIKVGSENGQGFLATSLCGYWIKYVAPDWGCRYYKRSKKENKKA